MGLTGEEVAPSRYAAGMAERSPESSYVLWEQARRRYQVFLEIVGAVQIDIESGAIPASRWPHARAVAERMGVSPGTVRRIVRDWDRFVDVALVEFGANEEGST
jgi:hypothetical protein